MPIDRLSTVLKEHVTGLEQAGIAKGSETVVVAVKPAHGDRGPRLPPAR